MPETPPRRPSRDDIERAARHMIALHGYSAAFRASRHALTLFNADARREARTWYRIAQTIRAHYRRIDDLNRS